MTYTVSSGTLNSTIPYYKKNIKEYAARPKQTSTTTSNQIIQA